MFLFMSGEFAFKQVLFSVVQIVALLKQAGLGSADLFFMREYWKRPVSLEETLCLAEVRSVRVFAAEAVSGGRATLRRATIPEHYKSPSETAISQLPLWL